MMLRLVRSALVGVLLACSTVLVTATLASANSMGTVSTTNGTIWSDCRQQTFNYALSLAPGTTYWNLEVTVLGHDGLERASDYLYKSGYPSTGTSTFQVCGGAAPGQWTLTATLNYEIGDSPYSTQLPPAHFSMRLPNTRTSLRASDRTLRHNQVFTFTIKTQDERPAGYFRTEYASVRLQRKSAGVWKTVRGGKTTTNGDGVAKLKFRYVTRGTSRVRAITVGDRYYADSTSSVVRLKKARG